MPASPLPDAAFWDDIATFAETLTDEIGRELRDRWAARDRQAEEKTDGSLITECDRWADGAIRAAIGDRFPDHGVLSEEGNHEFPEGDWCWVVDPIDGTTNFARGIPVWGISLGLLYRGEPVFGRVALPPLAQAFWGFWPGQSGLNLTPGAFCNGEPLRTSADALTDNHLFSFCSRSLKHYRPDFPCKVRMIGVATYNLLSVASGLTLGAMEETPKVWDLSAVWAIAHGAGAVWISLNDAPPFPLEPGRSYGTQPNPCLVVARADLGDRFRAALGV